MNLENTDGKCHDAFVTSSLLDETSVQTHMQPLPLPHQKTHTFTMQACLMRDKGSYSEHIGEAFNTICFMREMLLKNLDWIFNFEDKKQILHVDFS